jgi:hypothetical protein
MMPAGYRVLTAWVRCVGLKILYFLPLQATAFLSYEQLASVRGHYSRRFGTSDGGILRSSGMPLSNISQII